jgi:tetratricopeptide (TPR) repeat protein
VNRKLFVGISAWVLPSALLATLFRIEGQQDFWLVAAWLPLHLAVAVGLARISERRVRSGISVAAGLGLFWAIAVNAPSVSTRHYTLAEDYGRYHLDNVEQGAILILESDDALSTTQYLQVVKGWRPDVVLASASRFGSGWYASHLQRRHPRLTGGDTLKAFVEANAAATPIYFEAVPPEIAGSGGELVPAGPLLRMAPANFPAPAPWNFPVRLEDVRSRFGRARGIRLELLPEDLIVTPEPYEQRWVSAYVRAQAQLGQLCFRKGGDGNLRKAVEHFEAARAADPERPDRDVVQGLAVCHYLLGEMDRAEPLLKELLRLRPTPRQGVRALSFLATICRGQGRMQEALRYQDQAMAIVGSDPELRREFERQAPR